MDASLTLHYKQDVCIPETCARRRVLGLQNHAADAFLLETVKMMRLIRQAQSLLEEILLTIGGFKGTVWHWRVLLFAGTTS